jgi:hypothetical protein
MAFVAVFVHLRQDKTPTQMSTNFTAPCAAEKAVFATGKNTRKC